MKYLCSITGIQFSTPRIAPRIATQIPGFPESSNPVRFKGTRILLHSPSISPDYPFPATVIDCDTVYWLNSEGIRSKPYRLRQDDKIKITNLCDSEADKHSTIEVRAQRTQTDTQSAHNIPKPLETLAKYLKSEGIAHRISGDRLVFLFGKYYVEYDNSRYELYSERRGMLTGFPATERGLVALIGRIVRMEENFDSEKLLKKITND